MKARNVQHEQWAEQVLELALHRACLAILQLQNLCTLQWSQSAENASVLELDPVQGVPRPFLDDSPWSQGVQLQIDAGGVRVRVVRPSKTDDAAATAATGPRNWLPLIPVNTSTPL